MIHFRPFRNDDPPDLAVLWNRGAPDRQTARPLTAHEFDGHVVNRADFEAAGLIVAQREDRVVGFVHAGFGPEDPNGRPFHLNHGLGTVGMLVVDPGAEDTELEQGLIAEAERYLRRRGAAVLYGGGQYPLNPFYWGLYGGSEWAGVLSGHSVFPRALERAGYEAASTTVLLEADLTEPLVRDPKSAVIRRLARVEVEEDPLFRAWWDALALGSLRPTQYRLRSKTGEVELARALTWDMNAFGRIDHRSCLGLIGVEVAPAHRRQGYGRFLVGEILRQARADLIVAVAVQTRAENLPALALYQAAGFHPIETATLYRLPAHLTGRSD